MSIKFVQGDILSSNVEAIVNTVNCVGVMGRGIALQFKNAFPENFKAYKKACEQGEVVPGKIFVFENAGLLNPRLILNFPTKRHWKGKSRLEDIGSGLEDLKSVIKKYNIQSLAIPPLGSGLGGLRWSDVRTLIESALIDFPHAEILIYEPSEQSYKTSSTDIPEMTAGRAALVEMMRCYLHGFIDPFVSVLEIQKLLYFLQECYGQPLKLKFQKALYGPYAENLRHVLRKIEGHFISGYNDGGDAPNKPLELVPGVLKDVARFLEQDSGTKERIKKVASFVEGYEEPFGLELLATVHWVCQHEVRDGTLDEIVGAVHRWGKQKQKFEKFHIEKAYTHLQQHSLI